MTSTSMTPSSRPRRGVAAALALAGGAALAAALVVALPSDEAGAAELSVFASCEDLAAWGEESLFGAAGDETFEEVGGAVGDAEASASGDDASDGGTAAAPSGPASTTAPAVEREVSEDDGDSDQGGSDGDTTNVVVEGVDELDLIDRLSGDVWLVAMSGRLSIVDLADGAVRASHPVPYDAQVTFDRDRGLAWVVGHLDAGGVIVERVAVGGASFTSEGRWSTTGHLVDARRVGGALHLVAADGFPVGGRGPAVDFEGDAFIDEGGGDGWTDEGAFEDEFEDEGDGAVEEEGSVGSAVPTTSTLPPPSSSTGPSNPTRSTDDAREGSFPDEPAPTTVPIPDETVPPTPDEPVPPSTEPEETLPAPTVLPTEPPSDPDPTVPFPDGPVPCDEVLHPDGPSSPEATLLVTLPATGDLEPTHATEVVGSGSQVHVTQDAAYLATPLYEGRPVTTIHRFDLSDLTHTGSGRVEGSMLDEFSMSEHGDHLRVAVTTGEDRGFGMAVDVVGPTSAEDGDVAPTSDGTVGGPGARNEIVVLDTEGALDVVGRTLRFGKPGESIFGIRFSGDVAYAVTFLQTDPFYVVDLSDPAAPEVVGEVELPGFSSYLHPLSEDLVVGFGPGDDGRPAAKLFDVSDPTAPRVADDLVLGDDSAVVYDHHAFLDLGDGRFAVPATTWLSVTRGEVVVIDASGGSLDEVERVGTDGVAESLRVLPAGDGFALLTSTTVEVLPGSGGATGSIPLV